MPAPPLARRYQSRGELLGKRARPPPPVGRRSLRVEPVAPRMGARPFANSSARPRARRLTHAPAVARCFPWRYPAFACGRFPAPKLIVTPAQAGAQPASRQQARGAVLHGQLGSGLRRGDGFELVGDGIR